VKYSTVLVCASVLCALPPAAPPALPVALSVPPQKLLPAGPPEAHAEFFFRRRQRYKHTSVLKRPPQRSGHRLKLAEGTDMFNLPRCTSSESFFSCCNSVAALALANYNELVAEAKITAPAHTQRALHGAQAS
jgi:hypothetical protein